MANVLEVAFWVLADVRARKPAKAGIGDANPAFRVTGIVFGDRNRPFRDSKTAQNREHDPYFSKA
jgi:hypothetical protein